MGISVQAIIDVNPTQLKTLIEPLLGDLNQIMNANNLEFANSSSLDPFYFELTDDLISFIKEDNPDFVFNPETQSMFMFEILDGDHAPLIPNFLNSLKDTVDILLLDLEGPIEFDQLLEQTSYSEYLKSEIDTLRGKTLDDLKSMDLKGIFKFNNLRDYKKS